MVQIHAAGGGVCAGVGGKARQGRSRVGVLQLWGNHGREGRFEFVVGILGTKDLGGVLAEPCCRESLVTVTLCMSRSFR